MHQTENTNVESAQSEQIRNDIMSGKAVVATDATMKYNALASHQIVTNQENVAEMQGGMITTMWADKIIPAREAAGLLDLILHMKRNTSFCKH